MEEPRGCLDTGTVQLPLDSSQAAQPTREFFRSEFQACSAACRVRRSLHVACVWSCSQSVRWVRTEISKPLVRVYPVLGRCWGTAATPGCGLKKPARNTLGRTRRVIEASRPCDLAAAAGTHEVAVLGATPDVIERLRLPCASATSATSRARCGLRFTSARILFAMACILTRCNWRQAIPHSRRGNKCTFAKPELVSAGSPQDASLGIA